MPPTRSISPASSARSSLACASMLRSPISSRKSVPPLASSKRPRCRSVAPVKAPFSWPNISDSTRSRGMAAQLSLMYGPRTRCEPRWMSDAATSFPVPDSPVMSTRASVGAMRAIISCTCSTAGLRPTISSPSPSSSSSTRLISRACRSSSAEARVSSTASGVSGFSMKWYAPSLVALTASPSEARPLIMITGRCGAASRRRGSASSPVSPSMYRSISTASGSSPCTSASAARALPASRVW